MKEMHEAKYGGRGVEPPCSFQESHPLSTLISSPMKLSKPHHLGGLMEASLLM